MANDWTGPNSPPEEPWLGALERLAVRCGSGRSADDAALIRTTHRLMLTAPQRGNLPLSVVSAGVVEGLLDEGAFEAAALRLLPGGLGYMLSKAPNAREWIATTCLAGGAGETTFVGKTLASALLGAYAGTLREIARFAQAG